MLASTVSSKFLGALAEVEGFQFEVSIPSTLPLLINDIYHNVMLQSLVGICINHQSTYYAMRTIVVLLNQ